MMKVIVIGGKGTAVCIGEQIVHAQNRFGAPYEFLGWAIDDPALGDSINGYPILCGTRDVLQKFPSPDVKFIFALYKPKQMRARVELLASYAIPREKFATFVHPLAAVMPTAHIGSGTVVLSHSTIHSNVTLGDYSIVNPNVVIEHNTVLGDNNFVSSCACLGSALRIGNGVFIGLNAAIREQLTIGDYAFIGMGANVTRSVDEGTIVYGNPARPHA